MKHILIIAWGLMVIHPNVALGLSFSEDTIFLNADTESACNALGGDFMEWSLETYCTTLPDKISETTEVVTSSASVVDLETNTVEFLRQQLIILVKKILIQLSL